MELPRLEKLWKKYGRKGLSIVSIQSNQDVARGRAFIRESGLTFHLLEIEKDNDVVHNLYLSEGNPTTYVIDGEGRMVSYHLGFQPGDETKFEREIVELLGT